MKILVTGSFCSGKTTLSRYIADCLNGSFLITEPIRDLASVFGLQQLMNEASRHYLLVRQLFEEKKAKLFHDIIVCDAGIESNLAHSRLLGFNVANNISDIERLGHDKYDLIFFCDHHDVPVISDGFRIEDSQVRNELSKLIKNI